MDAAHFIAALKASGINGLYSFDGGSAARAEVADEIDFKNIDFDKNLTIKNAHFRGAVNLNNREFSGSVAFELCIFDRPIRLDKTTFKNGLSFSVCILGVFGKRLDQAVLLLDDAKICGDVAFYKVETYGRVTARRLELAGNLDFAACAMEAEFEG